MDRKLAPSGKRIPLVCFALTLNFRSVLLLQFFNSIFHMLLCIYYFQAPCCTKWLILCSLPPPPSLPLSPPQVGTTSMLSALMAAEEHWDSDSWYVLSDGLAHDPGQCLDFIEKRAARGDNVPAIHTVGFFPKGTPENFEGRRYLKVLAEVTGGSYQEYDRRRHQIYQDGVGFVPYDLALEDPQDRQVGLRGRRKGPGGGRPHQLGDYLQRGSFKR